MLNSKMQESKDLAELIQGNVIGTVKGKYGYPTRDNGVRSAPFYVLMGAKMPSVLMELGYCTNDAEARRLKSDNYLNRMADGIVAGVVAYKKKINRYASM
jgi:N-acetylmuramoyl-L-alanine amidase